MTALGSVQSASRREQTGAAALFAFAIGAPLQVLLSIVTALGIAFFWSA